MISGGSDSAMVDRLTWLEKSYKDGESLNLQLGKKLAESRQECNQLNLIVSDLKENLDIVTIKEEKSSKRLVEIEPFVDEVKELKEKTLDLEKNKMDFEMQLELAMEKKEMTIVDLRKYLESAYEEVATLESGNKGDVKSRFEKIRALSDKVNELESELVTKNNFVQEAESMKEEFDNLKEGLEVVTAEMEKLSEDKSALEQELRSIQTSPDRLNNIDQIKVMECENVKLSELIKTQSSEISNLELCNSSLLETVDDLSRKTDEAVQKNSELLVASAEIERFNVELKEEISQLKMEVKEVVNFKNKLEEEHQELKSELEEVVTSKADLEDFINRSQDNEEIDVLKKEMKQMEEDKAKLESMLKNDEKSQMMSKLSATLNSIEESFISVEEINRTCADKTCNDDSPSNASFANTTFGVPLEVVEEMKNQLIYLQQQLINFSPEELERQNQEIEQLKMKNSNLQLEVEELAKEHISPTNVDHSLAEKIEELENKHKAEIAIISTKMREEMNFNLPALEEKIRDEFEVKKQESIADINSKYEEMLRIMQEELRESKESLATIQQESANFQETLKKATENHSNQNNTTLGVIPLSRVESLNSTDMAFTTCEMSFDETIGNSSMNIPVWNNTVISGGIGDSLQVQMLKGELEAVKASFEEKAKTVEELEMELNECKRVNKDKAVEKFDANQTQLVFS